VLAWSRRREREAGMSRLEVTVSVDDVALHEFDLVVDRLRAAGLVVVRALPALGVVTGRIEARHLAALRQVRGVAHVERGRVVGVLSPDVDQE
jgi:hypothetical protein